jgi:PAS domain S-box-containing protein
MNRKILVVDDEESIRYTFSAFLEGEGYDVAVARGFDDAAAAIGSKDFDLVYADVILGGKTGIDVLREVKRQNRNCPVVMITGVPTVETSAESVRHGAFDYIPKPIRQETLLRITGMALKHKALLDEKERFRANLEAIYRGLRDAIMLVDEDLTVVEANEVAKEICGRRDVEGQLLYTLPVVCSEDFASVMEETIRTKKPVDMNRIECRREGEPPRVLSLSVSPLINRQGRFLGAVILIKDETRIHTLEKQLTARQQFGNIVGRSTRMQEVYSLIESLSIVDSTVLITGDSGTGKELVAEAIHFKGARSGKPLVKVNCSALTESLLESELFGHVKGAFTGAINDSAGRFQTAQGGTIFLDEIGDISPALQLRLLKVLQNKEIERVGDSKPIKVDVRVIAATNRDLRQLMREGTFREDLFYRIKVMEINMPPLRERKEDIPLLTEHFIEKLNTKLQKNIEGVSQEVLRKFMAYSWPGNIRELEHTIEHALILCQKSVVTLEDLPPDILEQTDAGGQSQRIESPQQKYSGTDERGAIIEALAKAGWNKSKAARILGISRRTIYRKMKEHGIDDSIPRM